MKPKPSNCYDYYFQIYVKEFFAITSPDWEWFKAQAIAESGLDPEAVSPAGALGVMQLMPGTAAEMARKLKLPNTPQVPHINIRLGVAYARQCWDMWKDERGTERLRFMFGSYNAGPGNILKAHNGRPNATCCTRTSGCPSYPACRRSPANMPPKPSTTCSG